jgi:uncharacterized BrkB/YihY/UPF0761 family membrane protein
VSVFRKFIHVVDGWQRRHRIPSQVYGVIKKFGDDKANLLVVSLGWYGFLAIFPLLLAVVTIFGFVGAQSLGSTVVSTLHKFPVVGVDFNPASSTHLHGSVFGLVIGLLGLIYGAQGVTQTAQEAMAEVWDVPEVERSGFVPRLVRSLSGLFIIGVTFLINAFGSTYATGSGNSMIVRILVIALLLFINVGLYYWGFVVLTPKIVARRSLFPGSVLGAVGFTLLITVGTSLINHQLKSASGTYGTFGTVIGLVAFLLLLAKLTMYGAELNPVLARRLYPRALPGGEPTEADRRVHAALAEQSRRRPDEAVEFRYNPDGQPVSDTSAGPVAEDGQERLTGARSPRR